MYTKTIQRLLLEIQEWQYIIGKIYHAENLLNIIYLIGMFLVSRFVGEIKLIMKYKIKYDELTEYLKTLKDGDFQRNWNKNPEAPMKEGHSIEDIVFLKLKEKTKKEKQNKLYLSFYYSYPLDNFLLIFLKINIEYIN